MLKVGQNPTNVRHSKKREFLKSPTQKVVFLQTDLNIHTSINKRNVLHIQHKHLSKIHLSICVSFTFDNYNKIFVYLTLITILYYGFYI